MSQNPATTREPAVTPLEVLRRDGWIKGYLGSRDEGFCLLGACGEARAGLRFERATATVVHEQFPDRLAGPNPGGLRAVALFNDHRDTTFADVEMVLEKAQIIVGSEVTADV